ncbi:sugar ABC transporter permease [Ruminococcaceae bacterium OttesenSCG-928-D13]|nr:sugar ABC transporter permease [Ruminococcaceae bacterium OttesenSCG-928-D13]
MSGETRTVKQKEGRVTGLRSKALGRQGFGYAMLVPATLPLILVSVYPVLRGVWLSLTNYNMLRPGRNDFVGLQNYLNMLKDDVFLSSLGFTFIYTLMVVVISYLTGFALALLLNREIRFRALFRTIFLLPWVIPSVVAVVNWTWIMNDQVGFINVFLQNIGLIDKPILFLADYKLIRPTVIMVAAWKQTPFMMITLLAGLQSVPKDLYEAASIDGAGFWRSLFNITLPTIQPVTYISTMLNFVWTFNSFENIWLMTAGGPNGHTFTLPIFSYYTAFLSQNTSYASAIASSMIVVLAILSVLYLHVQTRGKERKFGLKAGAVK